MLYKQRRVGLSESILYHLLFVATNLELQYVPGKGGEFLQREVPSDTEQNPHHLLQVGLLPARLPGGEQPMQEQEAQA